MKAENRVHTVAVRLNDDEIALIDKIAATMRSGNRSDALRWLIGQPESRALAQRQATAARSANAILSLDPTRGARP